MEYIFWSEKARIKKKIDYRAPQKILSCVGTDIRNSIDIIVEDTIWAGAKPPGAL